MSDIKAREKIDLLLEICKSAGWSENQAKQALGAAAQEGIAAEKYFKLRCWEMDEKEWSALVEKERRKKEAAELNTKKVMELSGCDYETAASHLKNGRKYGITGKQYISKYAWELSSEEQKELGAQLELSRIRQENNNDFYLDIVCRKSGWTAEKAAAEMNAAKKLGITWLKYTQREGWKCNPDEVQALASEVISYKKNVINENKGNYLQQIMNITSWSRGKAELEILKAKNNTGCSYEDFLVFRFWELTAEEQRKYVTLDLFNKMRLKYNDTEKAAKYFDDKAEFNRTFSQFISRRWFTNMNLDYDTFLQNIEGLDFILIKPLAMTQGKGIKKFACNLSSEGNRQLYEQLIQMDKIIIEQYIRQHDTLNALCPSSVNTVRITTLNLDGECHFLYSVLRMGSGDVVDNFHAGGIAASVNLKTGCIDTNAVNLNGDVFEKHPSSCIQIPGLKIPYWDQILDISRAASSIVPNVRLMGWDFAITPEGVELIEGNPGASYIVAQMPYVPLGVGLRDRMTSPFL